MQDILTLSLKQLHPREELILTERGFNQVEPRFIEFRRKNQQYHFMVKKGHGIRTIRRVA